MSRRDLILDAIAGKRPSRKGWVRANCPFCDDRHSRGPDRSSSFGIHVTRLRYECYRCGITGRLREPLDAYVGEIFDETQALKPVEVPAGYVPLVELKKSLAFKRAVDYVLRRGLTWDLIEAWRIGASIEGREAGRVIVPVFNSDGAWIWYVARAWSEQEAQRYLYPIGTRGGIMWNSEALSLHTNEPYLVVEGVFDAFPHWPNAGACLGKPNDEHLDLLSSARRPVVVALDGDAWEEAYAISRRLMLRGQESDYVHLLPKTDPGVTDPSVLRKMAIDAIEG